MSKGSGGEVKKTPPPKATAEEKLLLSLMMDVFEDPEQSPEKVVSAYLDRLAEADKMYQEMPDFVASALNPSANQYTKNLKEIETRLGLNADQLKTALAQLKPDIDMYNDVYQKEMTNISKMPSVGISFGGNQMAKMLPLKTMAAFEDLAGKKYGGGLGAIEGKKGLYTDIYNANKEALGSAANLEQGIFNSAMEVRKPYLASIENLPKAQVGLANEAKEAIYGPLLDTWKNMMNARFSVPSSTTPYKPGFLEQVAPIAGQLGGAYMLGSALAAPAATAATTGALSLGTSAALTPLMSALGFI